MQIKPRHRDEMIVDSCCVEQIAGEQHGLCRSDRVQRERCGLDADRWEAFASGDADPGKRVQGAVAVLAPA
jgi:hypothetical protein